jgi:hypothetical protein
VNKKKLFEFMLTVIQEEKEKAAPPQRTTAALTTHHAPQFIDSMDSLTLRENIQVCSLFLSPLPPLIGISMRAYDR